MRGRGGRSRGIRALQERRARGKASLMKAEQGELQRGGGGARLDGRKAGISARFSRSSIQLAVDASSVG